MTIENASGSCICGAARFTARNVSRSVGACHCNTCRRWGGGPLMAVDCGSAVSFESEDSVSVYDSSDWAERGFCSKCGTHLFYRLKHNHQYIMPVGLFGEDDALLFDHQVFVDEKPAFYQFANETSNMTGPEVFAKYGSSSE